MIDISNMKTTIVQKTDQLNAENLLDGPRVLFIESSEGGQTVEQPIFLHYTGGQGKPYKPCKTMRKMLLLAWGDDGRKWCNQSMRVYCEPTVKFGNDEVGGIRISHVTGIKKDVRAMLSVTRGKKAEFILRPLVLEDTPKAAMQMTDATTLDELVGAFNAAYRAAKTDDEKKALKATRDAMVASLTPDQQQP